MRTDMAKQIVALRDFANAPSISVIVVYTAQYKKRTWAPPNASIIILSAGVLN